AQGGYKERVPERYFGPKRCECREQLRAAPYLSSPLLQGRLLSLSEDQGNICLALCPVLWYPFALPLPFCGRGLGRGNLYTRRWKMRGCTKGSQWARILLLGLAFITACSTQRQTPRSDMVADADDPFTD